MAKFAESTHMFYGSPKKGVEQVKTPLDIKTMTYEVVQVIIYDDSEGLKLVEHVAEFTPRNYPDIDAAIRKWVDVVVKGIKIKKMPPMYVGSVRR